MARDSPRVLAALKRLVAVLEKGYQAQALQKVGHGLMIVPIVSIIVMVSS
jgi:hypothetical protein